MSRADVWRGASAVNRAWRDADRSYDVARLIAEKPASIVVKRTGAALPLAAQTVRIDYAETTPDTTFTQTASVVAMRVVVLGYKNHPAVADTQLRRGDRFEYEGQWFEVVQVQSFPDRLNAIAEATT